MSTVVEPQAASKADSAGSKSTRTFSTSLKAILQARHANTNRYNKRPPGQWMKDMIVVKTYSQTESLRKLLEKPAAKHSNMIAIDECKGSNGCCAMENENPLEVLRGVKRKLEEETEESDAGHDVTGDHDQKRRKLIEDSDKIDGEVKCDICDKSIDPDCRPGKENIPPFDQVRGCSASC